MQGYKVYFDIDKKQFTCEEKPSEVGNYTADGTTSWIDTYFHACKAVNKYNNNLNEVFICKDCGRSFWLTNKEQEWFKDLGLKLPKRCYACRKLKSDSTWIMRNCMW